MRGERERGRMRGETGDEGREGGERIERMRGGEVVRVDWLSVKSVSKTVLGLDDALVAKNSQKTGGIFVSLSAHFKIFY